MKRRPANLLHYNNLKHKILYSNGVKYYVSTKNHNVVCWETAW